MTIGTNRQLRVALLAFLAVVPADDQDVSAPVWEELAGIAGLHQSGVGIPPSPGVGSP